MSDPHKKKVAVTLTGNLQTDPMAQAKYGDLVRALDRQTTLLGVVDARIAGFSKYVNALVSFHPDLKRWKERFRKNPYAHKARTRAVSEHLKLINPKLDFILQLGALFDSPPADSAAPVYVYTDYTFLLAAGKPDSGRSPFNLKELLRLVDLERATFDTARKVFVRSRLVQQSVVEEYTIPAEKVVLVGGGVNFDPLPQIEDRPLPAHLLFIGLDFHRKGGDILLQAFEQVKAEIPETELTLVTRHELSDASSLPGVVVLPPVWQREKLAELYRSAGVFVLPSRLETWGDVLLEAMAFGLPCVGVRQDAMSEIISHGENGLLVPPDDPAALAAALIGLLKDPASRHKMGQQARARVEQAFTWDRVVAKILSEVD